jgi:hypothetical protein
MPDYKKLDEIDILICGTTTPEDDKLTSKYLQAYKAKQARNEKSRSIPSPHTKPKAKTKH